MKKSLSARLSVIFTGIIIAACLILVGTCAGIFKFTETTIKDIRYEDILDGRSSPGKPAAANQGRVRSLPGLFHFLRKSGFRVQYNEAPHHHVWQMRQ